MKMNDYIDCFTDHLRHASIIGESVNLKICKKNIQNVIVCGLGGSGIGGGVAADIVAKKIKIPIVSNKDYCIPSFVNENTLVIANSYSGNTEETISALKKCEEKGAEISIITSGGELEIIAKKKNYNNIIIPAGHPPRAMFGYSFVQLFYLLNHYGLINDWFKKDLEKAVNLLDSEKLKIQDRARFLANKLKNQTPVIYVANGFEGVGVRFRQQLNENSKMLCWHHVVPEMNHNELLGWRTNVNNLAVVFLRNKLDFNRNQIRVDINKKVLSKYTKNITEIWSEGDSLIQTSLYHINLGDWTSWYLSEINNVDAIEIDVINFLKNQLAKV